jgi:nucleotide-binding universal stress UspA family protein
MLLQSLAYSQMDLTSKNNDHPEHLNKVEYLVVHYGRIAEEIVKKANMWDCESIVLGPHRKRFLKQIFLKSISRKVIRYTHKRVHIIQLPKGEMVDQRHNKRDIYR